MPVLLLAGVLFADLRRLRAQAVPEPAAIGSGRLSRTDAEHTAGAQVLSTEQARAQWESGDAAFIDVLPQTAAPGGTARTGTIWRPRPRYDIPGSIWLPDTGYGALAPVMQDYFIRNLHAARRGRSASPDWCSYCLADCWMSWNAAKRALALGYSHIASIPEEAGRMGSGAFCRWRSESPYRAKASSPSEAPDFGLRLSLAQLAHDLVRLRHAELLAEITPGALAHLQHRLSRFVAVVRKDRGDDVDRARASLQRLPRPAVHVHAADT